MILQIQDIKTDGRPVTEYIDPKRVEIYIEEAEILDLKPQIGDPLYMVLKDWAEESEGVSYKELLEGGEYIGLCGQTKSFPGIKKALNYYVQARIVKNNNYNLTRFGLTRKRDQHSESVALNEIIAIEKDMKNIADKYMKECIEYLKAKKDKYPLFKFGKQRNRLQITIAGK